MKIQDGSPRTPMVTVGELGARPTCSAASSPLSTHTLKAFGSLEQFLENLTLEFRFPIFLLYQHCNSLLLINQKRDPFNL